jgi:probable lipoprotein NlpC
MTHIIATRILSAATLTTLLSLLAACSHSVPAPVDDSASRQSGPVATSQILPYLNRWRGVPHRYGGLDGEGIDCSGLVYRTYKDLYGLDLPRSTRYQSRVGQRVSADALRVGDLVFFKTGFRQRHVGIYVGNSSFIHSSLSKGVTRTSLNNPYWAKRFWKAKRVTLAP